jgi:drug/metabolite transporter (DMT)-like permease
MIVLALFGRVLFSAAASMVQKKLTLGGFRVSRLWTLTYALMALPALVGFVIVWKSPVGPDFWFNAIAAGILDALGNLAMVAALRSTHLSIFGPLNGFRPVLALLFGWVLLGEKPSALGAVGVIVTVVGVVLLLRDEAHPEARWTAAIWRMLALRAAGLALSTFGAAFLKRATLASSPAHTIGVWTLCGLPIFWLFSLRKSSQPSESPPTAGLSWIFAHAAFFFGMQWLTLFVFQTTLLAYSFAFFQLGMILQVFGGHWFFKEPHFGRRLLCCLVIGLGALLISLALI